MEMTEEENPKEQDFPLPWKAHNPLRFPHSHRPGDCYTHP
jgi:hypothetical protein